MHYISKIKTDIEKFGSENNQEMEFLFQSLRHSLKTALKQARNLNLKRCTPSTKHSINLSRLLYRNLSSVPVPSIISHLDDLFAYIEETLQGNLKLPITEDFEEFYTILKKNLSIRHNVFPTHSLSELVILKELYPDKINLFGAYLENEMIAGVINFIVNERVVLAFYISHDESYQELRPINLLFYKIFDWAIQNEFKVFDFGIFTVNEKPNMGLARFKENFGASGVFRDTMEINLLNK